ncbi:hypothetical protein NIES267_22840 [Calothrix parasitica NIES-267]|uniref:Uncharacterized protein n=1 Tax=Calothrix parasitica NIES-267 TaxID=1973488 RepID=A0A1Z4LNI8_9CYAN|nr:hypothetical protein NIES267_22840 [Calothrix parasitica NIES-267]
MVYSSTFLGLTQKQRNSVITSDEPHASRESDVFTEGVDHRKNLAIASLHIVTVAMTNLRCVSPDFKAQA